VNWKSSQKSSNEVEMGFSFNEIGSNVSRNYIILREGTLKTTRIGQLWLIDQIDFRNYLKNAIRSTDKRFGPHSNPPII